MSGPSYLRSTIYSGISNRHQALAEVERALDRIINAGPTQIQPDDREGFLNALLEDLQPSGIWQEWPDAVLVLALTAIRILGRNPIGSDTLLTTPHLTTLLYHSGTPIPSSTFAEVTLPKRPPHDSPSATETLKVLANLLLLHSAGRSRFFKAGGADAIALGLSGKDQLGGFVEDTEEISAERVFLLARIGFLVTLERKEAVEVMVNQYHIVNVITQHLYTRSPTPPNFLALSELFKLAANLIRFYPQIPGTEGEEGWDDRFAPLLPATLHHLHSLPYTDLAPPLSNAIQVLLFIPFLPDFVDTWASVPGASTSTSPIRAPSPVKQLLSTISGAIATNVSKARRGSGDTGSSNGLAPPRTPSPHSTRRSSDGSPGSQRQRETKRDSKALPKRLLAIFDSWCDTHVPFSTRVDDERRDGVVLDEVLPPLLLVMMKCAAGFAEMRSYLRGRLLPAELDRSPSAGALESRPGTLGNALRLMTSNNHPACRDSAGELMWAVCGNDAATLSTEIGYGNSAGLLFRKGLTGPPSAHVEELPADNSEERHPITALSRTIGDSANPALDAMSEEEKEREAERLFVLFDRLEKTKIISAQTGKEGGAAKGAKELMEDKLRSGEFSAADAAREEAEERGRREEEEREEEEAMRDLRDYKARQAKRP